MRCGDAAFRIQHYCYSKLLRQVDAAYALLINDVGSEKYATSKLK
jgi:hypothetical protein